MAFVRRKECIEYRRHFSEVLVLKPQLYQHKRILGSFLIFLFAFLIVILSLGVVDFGIWGAIFFYFLLYTVREDGVQSKGFNDIM